jgi:hypothetical protein
MRSESKGQRAGEGKPAAEEPDEQHVSVRAQPVGESAGGAKDTRANHGGGQVEEELGWPLPWRWISTVIIVLTLRGF